MTRPRVSDLDNRLIALDLNGPITYRGLSAADDTIAIEVNHHERIYPRELMAHWLAGFTAAQGASHQPHPGEAIRREPLRHLRRVLVNPDPEDQWRIEIRKVMELSRNEAGGIGVGINELAKRLGVNRKHLTDDLRFGHPGTLSILAHLGDDLFVSQDRAAVDPDEPVGLYPFPGFQEPSRMRVLRVLAVLHERGIINWTGPLHRTVHGMVLDPTHLMSHQMVNKAYEVVVGEREHSVPAAAGLPWAVGVADHMDPDLALRIYLLDH